MSQRRLYARSRSRLQRQGLLSKRTALQPILRLRTHQHVLNLILRYLENAVTLIKRPIQISGLSRVGHEFKSKRIRRKNLIWCNLLAIEERLLKAPQITGFFTEATQFTDFTEKYS